MIRRTFLKGAAAVSFSLMVSPSLTVFAKDAVRVYTGGPIFTMNKNNDIVEAVAIQGDTILAVGTKSEVLAAAGPDAAIVDLKGKALIPGMIDGHSHFPSGAFNELTMVNLNVPPLGKVESIADMQKLLKERAAQTKKGEWIIGYNYNDLAIKEQRHPTRTDLDAVSTEHPIFIKHVSGHLGVANSKALELAGITEERPNPEGGKFRRDPDGKLDGVLEGPAAQAPVTAIRPQPTAAQYEEAVRRDSMVYAAAGITTANNGGSPTVDDLFLKASENGDLGIRVVIWPNGRNAKVVESYGKKRQGTQLDKEGKVFLGPVKLFADGSPQGYTAWFSKPYFKQLPGKPADFRGFPVFNSREELFALVQKLHDDGWQITTHTNGDQAIQDMIDAYSAALKKNPRKDHRHVLNHCQFCRPDQVEAIAEMGFVPSYFVTHTWFWGDIHRDMGARTRGAYQPAQGRARPQDHLCPAQRYARNAHQPAHGRILGSESPDFIGEGSRTGSAHRRYERLAGRDHQRCVHAAPRRQDRFFGKGQAGRYGHSGQGPHQGGTGYTQGYPCGRNHRGRQDGL